MRRMALSLLGFLVGTTVLVGLKSTMLGPATVVADAPVEPGDQSSIPATPGQAGTAGPAGPTSTDHPTAGPSPRPGPTTGTSRPTATPPVTTSTTTTSPPKSVTVTGVAVAVRTAQSPTTKSSPCGECHDYTISVTITVTAGKVTSASASYNTSPGASLSYANKANTSLSRSILSAQTWNLGRVSGATYSGNAWELSVKDALSRAGLS